MDAAFPPPSPRLLLRLLLPRTAQEALTLAHVSLLLLLFLFRAAISASSDIAC